MRALLLAVIIVLTLVTILVLITTLFAIFPLFTRLLFILLFVLFRLTLITIVTILSRDVQEFLLTRIILLARVVHVLVATDDSAISVLTLRHRVALSNFTLALVFT